MITTTTCFYCQKPLPEHLLEEKISRRTECPSCSRELRVCKMCKYYDPSSYNECREPNAERVVDKEKTNFCDYFHLSGNQSQNEDRQNLIDAANMLFKEKK